MENLISIIVLSYNSQSTILKTLDSIVNQTYKNLEIIVTDDCSSDKTIEIVKEWQNSHTRLKRVLLITSSMNTGVAANANRGLKAASGIAVKILAADDTLEPEAIEVFWEYYKHNKEKIIYQSKAELIDENDNLLVSRDDNGIPNLNYLYDKIKSEKQYQNLLRSNFIISPALGLINKKIFDKYGLFDVRFSMIEDYPYYLKLSKNGYIFRLIDKKLVNYRISSSSLCHSLRSKSRDKYLLSYAKFIMLIKLRWSIKEAMYSTALKDFLRAVKSFIIVCIYHKFLDFIKKY